MIIIIRFFSRLGYPVQARELTGLQSILQNQIEKFGQHFFKEGAKVIPGNTAYSSEYFAVELNNSHLGVPVEFYIDQLIDRKIIGATTGVTAIIKQILMSENSENGNLTLYISYMSSGVEDSNIKVFADGELLIADSDIVSGIPKIMPLYLQENHLLHVLQIMQHQLLHLFQYLMVFIL